MMLIIASFCTEISRLHIHLSEPRGPAVASFDKLWTLKLGADRANRTDSWPLLTDLELTVHKDGEILLPASVKTLKLELEVALYALATHPFLRVHTTATHEVSNLRSITLVGALEINCVVMVDNLLRTGTIPNLREISTDMGDVDAAAVAALLNTCRLLAPDLETIEIDHHWRSDDDYDNIGGTNNPLQALPYDCLCGLPQLTSAKIARGYVWGLPEQAPLRQLSRYLAHVGPKLHSVTVSGMFPQHVDVMARNEQYVLPGDWRGVFGTQLDFDVVVREATDLHLHAAPIWHALDRLLEEGNNAGAHEYQVSLRAIGGAYTRPSTRYILEDGFVMEEEEGGGKEKEKEEEEDMGFLTAEGDWTEDGVDWIDEDGEDDVAMEGEGGGEEGVARASV
jgi:hypothetical protein